MSKEACRIIGLTHKDDAFLAAAMSNYASCSPRSFTKNLILLLTLV